MLEDIQDGYFLKKLSSFHVLQQIMADFQTNVFLLIVIYLFLSSRERICFKYKYLINVQIVK